MYKRPLLKHLPDLGEGLELRCPLHSGASAALSLSLCLKYADHTVTPPNPSVENYNQPHKQAARGQKEQGLLKVSNHTLIP